jgi:hypothetical protein
MAFFFPVYIDGRQAVLDNEQESEFVLKWHNFDKKKKSIIEKSFIHKNFNKKWK